MRQMSQNETLNPVPASKISDSQRGKNSRNASRLGYLEND